MSGAAPLGWNWMETAPPLGSEKLAPLIAPLLLLETLLLLGRTLLTPAEIRELTVLLLEPLLLELLLLGSTWLMPAEIRELNVLLPELDPLLPPELMSEANSLAKFEAFCAAYEATWEPIWAPMAAKGLTAALDDISLDAMSLVAAGAAELELDAGAAAPPIRFAMFCPALAISLCRNERPAC